MMSYSEATEGSSPWATKLAMLVPLPPGPPGLTSKMPCCLLAGAVAGTSVSASVILRPDGWL